MKTLATIERTYTITRRAWFVQDAPSDERMREVEFHIQSGDYIPTLATILMLVADSLRDNRMRGELPSEFSIATLEALKEELMLVHPAYSIMRKPASGQANNDV